MEPELTLCSPQGHRTWHRFLRPTCPRPLTDSSHSQCGTQTHTLFTTRTSLASSPQSQTPGDSATRFTLTPAGGCHCVTEGYFSSGRAGIAGLLGASSGPSDPWITGLSSVIFGPSDPSITRLSLVFYGASDSRITGLSRVFSGASDSSSTGLSSVISGASDPRMTRLSSVIFGASEPSIIGLSSVFLPELQNPILLDCLAGFFPDLQNSVLLDCLVDFCQSFRTQYYWIVFGILRSFKLQDHRIIWGIFWSFRSQYCSVPSSTPRSTSRWCLKGRHRCRA